MWPFTGGCHYAKDCERYTESCGSCPHLDSSVDDDLSRNVYRNKREVFDEIEVRIVTPSAWLSRQAERSSLFGECPIETIPNPVDVGQFRPRKPNGVRQQLDLSEEKLLIGTGADRTTRRKGIDLFFEAITDLSIPTSEAELVLFGRTDSAARSDTEYDLNVTGFVDDETLRRLFSELDVLVVPSRQEAFGQTASEALASGTPVVAFDATGPSTIVTHESTGYLAEPFDAIELARGIEWVLGDEERRTRLGERARTDAVERFDMPVVARQYRQVYEDALG
jgi:glycosyltransferase involved in cell wall biosynthesis